MLGRIIGTVVGWAVLSGAETAVGSAEEAGRRWSRAVLRATGVAALVRFYRHFGFNLPRTTTVVGVGLLAGLAAVHGYLCATGTGPLYLSVYFAVITAAAVVVACLVAAARTVTCTVGWWAGSVTCVIALLVYLVSQVVGLPGAHEGAARWEHPLGTVTMALSVAYVGLHFTVITGVMVASPYRQLWHD